LRRTVSLEDINTVSAIHRALLDEEEDDDCLDISSFLNSVPVPSDTQSAVHHQHHPHLQEPRPRHHSPRPVHPLAPYLHLEERPQSAMSMRDYQSYYTHYRPDQELHDIARPQTPEVGLEDTLKPVRSRDSQATDDCQPASPNSGTPPELVDKAN